MPWKRRGRRFDWLLAIGVVSYCGLFALGLAGLCRALTH